MTSVHEPVRVAGAPASDEPEPSRARRILPPVATALGVTLATAFIARVDPNSPGHYPVCPTQALFGIDCPACGGLRATHALAHGDIAGAMDHNLVFVLAVPFIIGAWALWFWRAWTGTKPEDTPRRRAFQRYAPMVLLVVLVVFGVVRNFVPYLGSGVG